MRKALFGFGLILLSSGFGGTITMMIMVRNGEIPNMMKPLNNFSFFLIMLVFVLFTLGVYLVNTNKPEEKD